MSDNRSYPPIGLALSGGVVLGAAHVGVLRALEEEGIRTGWAAGTSAGAIVAALHAFGMPVDEIASRLSSLSWLSVTNFRPSRLGLLGLDRLADFMRETLGDVNLEDAELPLAVVAADIHTGEKIALRTGNLATAVSASACIPGIFTPVDWESRLLVDGGIVENLPLDTVRALGADRVLGVDLHTAGLYPEPKSIIDIVLNASSILVSNTRMLYEKDDDVIISPQLNAYNALDTGHVPELIEEGYRCAQDHIEAIRSLIA
jgi:NTE family protein